MAKNTGDLKRTVYKYLRDGVKSNYTYGPCCQVCGSTEDLELHHPHSFSLMFDKFCEERGITVTTQEEVFAIRDVFYQEYWEELVVDVLTLCNTHHKALHKVYGNIPPLSTANKQKEWVQRIRDKNEGKESHSSAERNEQSYFSSLIPKGTPTSFSDFIRR